MVQESFTLAQTINQSAADSPSILKGNIQENNKQENGNKFTGTTQEIKPGTTIKMTVSQVLSSGINTEGNEFFAEVTNDLTAPGGVALPSGTVVHGKISKIRGTRRLGRDAYMSVKFDYMITPDGRQIPVEASMSTKKNPALSVARVALQDTAITAAGGIIGGFMALKFLGLGAAIASHGYTVAGGAGVGALFGATVSLIRKGEDVLLSPGDEINVHITSDMQLPVMKEEALNDEEKTLDGLNVKITNYTLDKDPFGELNTITINLDINNKTDKTFSSFDMALVNDYNSVFYPSPFGDTELWFQKITPNTETTGKLSFAVDNPKRKHWLVFYDSATRKILAKISLKNAERRLKKEQK